jgi:hypothetical protein
MWWQTKIETKTMFTKFGVNSKHKLSWNTTSFYGLNTQWFHVEFLQAIKWHHSSKASTMAKSFLSWISWLIYVGKNLWEWKPTRWKKNSSPSSVNTMFIANLEAFIFKTKGLERSTWINNGVVMKEAFKDWNALSASTPQEKG